MARMLFICVVYASVLKFVAMAISTTSPPVAPGMSRPQSLSVNYSEINTNSMDSSLLKYLRKFKYLDPSPCTSCDQDSSIISEALSTLQQWAQINTTGILDSDTVKVMSKRRCGVPDEPKQFSVSNIKSKRHKRGFFWQIYHGSRWYKNDLTYIINMPHKFPNKRAVEKIISAALHAWESVTKLTFTQKRYGHADIEVNFLTGRHGDGSPFDGNGGILAHAFFPYDNSPGLSGDAHFDADEDWGSEMDMNTTADLYCVAVHEFGHSLGLMHSRWPISIMWPWMKGDCTLSKFDIAVIQKIYGSASERKWKRPRPTAYPPQTTHPSIKPNRPPTPTPSPSPSTTTISSLSPSISSSSSTTTISSSSSPSTTSSSSTKSSSQTITRSIASITTDDIKTTTSTVDTAITNAYTSLAQGQHSTTIRPIASSLENSKTSPVPTDFVSYFQPSTTMVDLVLAPEDNFLTQESTVPNLPPSVENSPTSSMISSSDILPSKNPSNSLVFQTSSSPNGVYEEKTFGILVSKKSGSSPENQPATQENSSEILNPTPSVLASQTQPFSPNIWPLKNSSPESTSSNQREKTFKVLVSEKTGSSHKNQPATQDYISNRSNPTPSVYSSQTQSFSPIISSLKNSSPENTLSNQKEKIFSVLVSEKTQSSHKNQTAIQGDLSEKSNPTPGVFPYQTQPFSPNIWPFKSSLPRIISSNRKENTFKVLVSEKSGTSPKNQPTVQKDLSSRSNPTPSVLPSQTQPFSPNIWPLKSTSSNRKQEMFRVLVSEKTGSSHKNQYPTQGDLSEKSNPTPGVLPSQTQPFSLNILPLKSSSSKTNINGQLFTNSLSTPESFTSQSGAPYPNDLTLKPQSFNSNIFTSVSPLISQTGLVSKNPSSKSSNILFKSLNSPNIWLFKSSSPESTSSNQREKTFKVLVSEKTGSSSENQPTTQENLSEKSNPMPGVLPSQTQPFSSNIWHLKNSSPKSTSSNQKQKTFRVQKSSPLLSTLFFTSISPSDLYSLPSANHFHTNQDLPKDRYYLNKVDEMYVTPFSRLPKLPSSSSWNQRLYLATSKQPLYQPVSSSLGSLYQSTPDPTARAAAATGPKSSSSAATATGPKSTSSAATATGPKSTSSSAAGPKSSSSAAAGPKSSSSSAAGPKSSSSAAAGPKSSSAAGPKSTSSSAATAIGPKSSSSSPPSSSATGPKSSSPPSSSAAGLKLLLSSSSAAAAEATGPKPSSSTSAAAAAATGPKSSSASAAATGPKSSSSSATATGPKSSSSSAGAGGENGPEIQNSKLTSPEETQRKGPPLSKANEEKLIPVTNRPKSNPPPGMSPQVSDNQLSQKTQDHNSVLRWFHKKHLSSSTSTHLYKTATVSMTTKPVIPLNEFDWMLTSVPQVTDSKPAIYRKTPPEFTASFQLLQTIYNEPHVQRDPYFDTAGFTEVLFFDQETSDPRIQERTLPIPKEQENWEVFRLNAKVRKMDDKNGGKTVNNLIDKKEVDDRRYQEETISELPYILQASTDEKSFQNFYINTYNKLEPTTSKYTKFYRKPQLPQTPTSSQTKRTTPILRVPPISSEAVPHFGKSLRQQNQERGVFSPSSLQESVMSTFLKSNFLKSTPTRAVPFVDLTDTTLSSSATLFAGSAAGRRTHPLMRVVNGKKRVKMFKPRFRQKMNMQQFIQTLLYSTMHMMPAHGPPLRDTKYDPLTTPSLHQDVGTRTLSAPPTNRMLSRIATSSLKVEPYLIPRAISHRFLSSQSSPTTQKWTGDTQRNLPQISDFQARESAKNYLRESLRISSPDQQTTPLSQTIQDPNRQQSTHKDNGNLKSQESSLLPFGLKLDVSGREDVQTTSETIFHRIITPYQRERQQMVPLSIYARRLKDNQEETGSLSRINKRSFDGIPANARTIQSENWTLKYTPTLTTSPSLVFPPTLYGRHVNVQNISPGGDDTIKGVPQGYVHCSERDGITTTTTTMITDPIGFRGIQPWCSGFVQIDGATIDGNGTINIFSGSGVMRFPFSAKGSGRKRGRDFIAISRIFPNGPNNITAAATISLGKKKKWERTYLFQGHLVWRYRKCRRRYCLDRGYPTNISQEFNVSTPIEVTAAYTNDRRRTLFLFNGTSSYYAVRCRWLRKSSCSSTETEMQPGLLSSLRGIDAMFTHQGSFYVVHGGSYFTTMLRSMKNNVFQHGSIAQSWYGCPQNIP